MQISLLGRHLVQPTRSTPAVTLVAVSDPTKETRHHPEMPQLEGVLRMGPFFAKGGSGSVHRGQWLPPGRAPTPVAIKKIDLSEVGEKGVALKVKLSGYFTMRDRCKTDSWLFAAEDQARNLYLESCPASKHSPFLRIPNRRREASTSFAMVRQRECSGLPAE